MSKELKPATLQLAKWMKKCNELQAKVEAAEKERDIIREEMRTKNMASSKALDELWKDIILKHKPKYGDWEYPMQAYRHIMCEFNDLTAKVEELEKYNAATIEKYEREATANVTLTAKLKSCEGALEKIETLMPSDVKHGIKERKLKEIESVISQALQQEPCKECGGCGQIQVLEQVLDSNGDVEMDVEVAPCPSCTKPERGGEKDEL